MCRLKIDYNCESIYAVDDDFYLKNHIKNLIIDLDQTLDSPFSKTPCKQAKDFILKMKEMNIRVIIVSNNTKNRVIKYCHDLPVECIYSARKMFSNRIYRYLLNNNISILDSLFVGDQLLTDCLYVNRIKGKFLLVQPLTEKDNIFTKVNRKIDIIIRRKKKKNNQLGSYIGGKSYGR